VGRALVSDPSAVLDAASEADARAMLTRCCGAARWVEGMLARRPFGSREALLRAADEAWASASRDDVLEALTHHPRIGANMDELRKKFASTATWSAGEQAGAAAASEETLVALRDGNVRYEARFGHIFVVCATGKTAAEMLALLEARMPNDAETEIRVAQGEQGKITKIRLEKLSA
jgi:2-oxo-4-hydroxy-4-carboxy-5-ureidoimidazoline decarboxylase